LINSEVRIRLRIGGFHIHSPDYPNVVWMLLFNDLLDFIRKVFMELLELPWHAYFRGDIRGKLAATQVASTWDLLIYVNLGCLS